MSGAGSLQRASASDARAYRAPGGKGPSAAGTARGPGKPGALAACRGPVLPSPGPVFCGSSARRYSLHWLVRRHYELAGCCPGRPGSPSSPSRWPPPVPASGAPRSPETASIRLTSDLTGPRRARVPSGLRVPTGQNLLRQARVSSNRSGAPPNDKGSRRQAPDPLKSRVPLQQTREPLLLVRGPSNRPRASPTS